MTVPVYHALLPQADAIVPYLRRIDANRWYSNRGELVELLEKRLTALIGEQHAGVMTAANGTDAIEAAILAVAGRATAERPLALMPAHTFVATATAVEACGYRPYLLDVDAQTWALDASNLANHPMLDRAGVVVPVSPYGRSIAQAPWRAFREQTGVPVVIDGAAAFESLLADPQATTGDIPVTLSFQATKAFSSGEGGAVVWSDLDGLKYVARALNFGFLYKRESTSAGTNGKMSEYHAAVGLASLDAWSETCHANQRVARAYVSIAQSHGIASRLFVAPIIASNYALFDAGTTADADRLMAALAQQQIETRRWYGLGIHREPYWHTVAAQDPLPVTDRLASALVGLPIATDITDDIIERIVSAIVEALPPATLTGPV